MFGLGGVSRLFSKNFLSVSPVSCVPSIGPFPVVDGVVECKHRSPSPDFMGDSRADTPNQGKGVVNEFKTLSVGPMGDPEDGTPRADKSTDELVNWTRGREERLTPRTRCGAKRESRPPLEVRLKGLASRVARHVRRRLGGVPVPLPLAFGRLRRPR